MAELNVNEKQLTASQLGCVLNDIAQTAKAIERFSVMQRHAEDGRDIEALTHSIETMAQRIGLLADATADELPGSGGAAFGTSFAAWMMPPAYHETGRPEGRTEG